ncbi:helix-turn-helix transcriptional regulator [Aliiruegeria sabulilitoris]|uniref:helix-turn-helix transcriptional regulator n=1 Tax=Aliiruegeria sabulilitoris TaxID=1510458 RepID=UPI00082DF017|nr:helix-turn-helix transcriptional regulator [Aliiruegeria sabulilitoris]
MPALDLYDLSTDRSDRKPPQCEELHQAFDRICVALARLRSLYLEHPVELVDWTEKDRERLSEILGLLDMLPVSPLPHERGECEIGLSPREAEILRWIARGKSNSVIAEILGISPHTVDTHIRRIYRKLGAGDRTTAALRGMETGLL